MKGHPRRAALRVGFDSSRNLRRLILVEETIVDKVIGEPRKMQAFEVLESNVRSYSRLFPTIFSRARASVLLTEEGRNVLDFLSGGRRRSFHR